jgi:hypothetical protein
VRRYDLLARQNDPTQCQEFLQSLPWEILGYLSYDPDFALSVCHLFGSLKH